MTVDSGQSTGNPVFRRFRGQEISDLGRALNGDGAIVVGLVLAWIGWTVSDTVSIDLAFGETYRYRIALVGWQDTWSVLRWAPGWIGIIVAGVPALHGSFDRSRTLSCLALAGALLALRLVSFLPGVGSAIPVLGVVWTVHVSWALSLGILLFTLFPKANRLLIPRSGAIGVTLLVCFGLLYSLYAVFFVRTTILHGDEPQYLMISQSLLQDLDIDLANTTEESVLEFHEANVYPHGAPASPPGKIHPKHPVGLGALFAPFYWLGLETIGHPRLACALLVAVTMAFAVFLTHRWLIQLQITPAGALATSIAAGCSPLMFLHSNQLYPEVFALVTGLAVMTTISAQLFKRHVRFVVFGCVLVLVALPMLHQRLLPLVGFLGLLLFLKLRDVPDRVSILNGCGVIVALSVIAYIIYHLHFSGDIWGPFKPGNTDVLDFEHLPTALFGQWLDVRVGLLNNSPLFLGVLVGLVGMAVCRDRRLLIAIGIYVTTACVNALSNDWQFGYCFPGRFMVTALPSLLILLAYTMDRALSQSVLLTFVLMLGVCVGMDTNYTALMLTEGAYDGGHLTYRALDALYPVGIHFPLLKDVAEVPWRDIICWLGLVMCLAMIRTVHAKTHVIFLIAVALAVCALTNFTYEHRSETTVAPALRRFSATETRGMVQKIEDVKDFRLSRGEVPEEGNYTVSYSGVRSEVAGRTLGRRVFPSVYDSILPATAILPSDGTPGGYYVLTKRYSVQAYGNHETRYAVPIVSDQSHARMRFVQTSGHAVSRDFITYRKGAKIQFGSVRTVQHPLRPLEDKKLEISRKVGLRSQNGLPISYGFPAILGPGLYRLDLRLEAIDRTVWIDRSSDPLQVIIFMGVEDIQDGREKARAWYPTIGRRIDVPDRMEVERPAVEALLSPFWADVPFLDQMKVDFENESRQILYVAIYYSGEYDLYLRSIDIYRRSFTSAVDGSPYVLPVKIVGKQAEDK